MKLTPTGLVKLVDFGLVKQMVPDELTITVIQGRGTALYTPLEQYGGDTGHTDVRSDIYAFAATLYHLLTNQPPVEAKQRFLRANALRPPRELNTELDPKVERAILWAMSLHPDDRPPTVRAFCDALLAKKAVPAPSAPKGSDSWLARWLPSPVERTLAFFALIQVLVAIWATLS